MDAKHCYPPQTRWSPKRSGFMWLCRTGFAIGTAWTILAAVLGPQESAAQNICLRHDSREACLVHTIGLPLGCHVWALWTDNFYQRTVLDTVGFGSLCYRLTDFNSYIEGDTMQWCPSNSATGEYELAYGWCDSLADTLHGPTVEDGFSFKDHAIEEASDSTWIQFSVAFEHDEEPMELELFYRAYTDGYLERWTRLTNTSQDSVTGAPGEDTLFVWHLASYRRQLTPPDWTPQVYRSQWMIEWLQAGQAVSYEADAITPNTTSLELDSWSDDDAMAWFVVGADTTAKGTVDWQRLGGFFLGLVQPSIMYSKPFLCSFETPDGTVDTLDLRIFNLYQTRATDMEEDESEGDPLDETLPQRIPPLMSLETTHAYFMFTDGTLADASERTHGFIRNHYVPPALSEPDSFPRTEFLTYFWDAWGFTYDDLMTQANICQELGIELFVIDANWNRYSISSEPTGVHNFSCYCHGSGYWVSDSCRFDPKTDGTLVDLIDELQADSMEVGLWVYPASIDTTMLSTVYDRLTCWGANPPDNPCFCDSVPLACTPWDTTWHTIFGGNDQWRRCTGIDPPYSPPCPFVYPPRRNLGELCCAHDSARIWIKAQVERLIDPDCYGASYLKFDGGMHPCMSILHSHRTERFPGDTLRRRVQQPIDGAYQLLGELLEDYPGTILEIGWPLGHIEVGEDPMSGVMMPFASRYSRESLRWFTLPQYAAGFLYEEPMDTLGLSQSEKLALRRHFIRSAMLGPLKISCDLTKWSSPWWEVVEDGIQYYKSNRRFLRGESYSILRQGTLTGDYYQPQDSSWDAVEFFDPDSNDARVFVFRNEPAVADTTRVLKLNGLSPDSLYSVRGVDCGEIGIFTGDSLMNHGVTIHLPCFYSSEILEVVPDD